MLKYLSDNLSFYLKSQKSILTSKITLFGTATYKMVILRKKKLNKSFNGVYLCKHQMLFLNYNNLNM